jgi:hypothetical protein
MWLLYFTVQLDEWVARYRRMVLRSPLIRTALLQVAVFAAGHTNEFVARPLDWPATC